MGGCGVVILEYVFVNGWGIYYFFFFFKVSNIVFIESGFIEIIL